MSLEIGKAGNVAKCKALIYGPPGQGKTVFLGTLNDDPRTGPVLILDFEGGSQSLSGSDVDVAPIHSWTDYNEAYHFITKGEGAKKYNSVAIDSVSETHIFALLSILKGDEANRKNIDLVSQQDYGVAMIQMRKLLRAFRNLDKHVFFTAHSKDEKDPREGLVKIPSMAGQLATEVPGMMDLVAYLALAENEDGDTIRTLLLTGHAKFRTKARTPFGVSAPTEIDEPTAGKLLDALGYPMPEAVDEKAEEVEPTPKEVFAGAKVVGAKNVKEKKK